jgi:hypothetical protein
VTSMSELPAILTPQELATFMKVTPEAVLAEIEAGRVKAFRFGGETRIWRESITSSFAWPGDLPEDLRANADRVCPTPPYSESDFRISEITAAEPFDVTWPTRKGEPRFIERYSEAYECHVTFDDGQKLKVIIGITKRASSGKDDRERVVVLIDGQPVLEFVGADDFEQSRLTVSVIKPDGAKHLRAGDEVPPAYSGFDIRPFNQIVTGPNARKGLAVVCTLDDRATMVRHAIVRWRSKRATR